MLNNVAEAFEDYVACATDPIPRIGFGFDFFDRPTGGGLARSEVAMLQAFSSVGKTTVAANRTLNQGLSARANQF